MKKPRPFVYVNTAITADGKIAPANRQFSSFTTKRDQELMMELRAEADAVMSGAATVMAGKVDLGPGGPEYRKLRVKNKLDEFNLRVVVSGRATLDPAAHIFTRRYSPIIVITSGRAPQSKVNALSAVADEVYQSGTEKIDWLATLEWLREQWKVKRLLCEGGGELNGALFEAGVVDELHLTIAPILLGGREAPTLADGVGALRLKEGVELGLKKLQRVGDELYLVYQVKSAH